MPTGYTSDIYNGKDVTGKDFILTCAHAFGALIHMRDDGLSSEVCKPEPPNEWHQTSLAQAIKELEKYQNMSIEDAEVLAEKEYNTSTEEYERYHKDNEALRKRYLDVLGKVVLWQPPTKEHVSLKEFAIQQLNESMSFDCKDVYTKPTKRTGKEIIDSNIKSAMWNIEYHSKGQREAQERYDQQCKWIDDLVNSL